MQQIFQSALFWTLVISCSYLNSLKATRIWLKDFCELALERKEVKKPGEEEGDAVETLGYFSGMKTLANDFFSLWIWLSCCFHQ